MAPRSERAQEFCPWCGQPLRRIVAHGETRCAACHMPVDVCCEGAPLREHEVPVCPIPGAPEAPVPAEPAAGSGEKTPAGAQERRPAEADRGPSGTMKENPAGSGAGRRSRRRS